MPLKFNVSRTMERTAQAFAALAIAFYSVSGLAYLYFGSWPVTHQDFWQLYQRALTHSWLQSALLKYGPHSIFFPSFFWLTDLRFFHGKQQPLVIAGILLLSITVSLLLIPIWRDKNVSLTGKILSALVLVTTNFWMGRSIITASGGFNCICSSVMVGAAIAFLVLPRMNGQSRQWLAALIVVCGGFLASFSFGSGLAIWPTLLLLAWCLRLRTYSIGLLAVASVVAAVVLVMLPGESQHLQMQLLPSIAASGGIWLCQIIGTPVAYAIAGWRPQQLLSQTVESSMSVWFGAAGLTIALVIIGRAVYRRDIGQSRLKLTGLALVTFSILVATSIVVPLPLTRGTSSDVDAPRYLFWSTLFWGGLLLLLIARGENVPHLRWIAFCIPLATPVFAFPSHQRWALHSKYAQILATDAATSLINRVRDIETLKIIAPVYLEFPYMVAPQLRAHRLGMFADGLQDWIGLNEASLFAGRHKPEGLLGTCRVSKLVQSDTGAPAARIVCHVTTRRHIPRIVRCAISPVAWLVDKETKQGYMTPNRLAVIDSNGIIRGVARSCGMSSFANRVLFQGKFCTTCILGYISDYNPQLHYIVRSADDNVLSEEALPVQDDVSNNPNS